MSTSTLSQMVVRWIGAQWVRASAQSCPWLLADSVEHLVLALASTAIGGEDSGFMDDQFIDAVTGGLVNAVAGGDFERARASWGEVAPVGGVAGAQLGLQGGAAISVVVELVRRSVSSFPQTSFSTPAC